ncbi:MAG: signal peptidase I, partial [Clostridia bacterium]|nr:signal peptidase I [Clostridia bacterium]
KNGEVNYGDIIAFYYNNKILIKRVIALPGDWIDIKQDGTVYVNGSICNEPYISEKAFGDCNIEMPYQVPDAKYFVMGDHRLTSTDSRNSALGCVSEEQIVGRILFRVWPLNEIGRIE